MKYLKLNNGMDMPLVGFGVFQIEKEKCTKAVLDAISVGYRLIDTAQAYYNEEYVGEAISKCGVARRELFITTKVWVSNFSYDKTYNSVIESMNKLKVDYIDLVLIHQCLGDYYSAYNALETLYKEGKIRAIGISNFSAERMADISTFSEIRPQVNQVETHIFFQQDYLDSWMKEYDIVHEAWGPLSEHRVKEVIDSHILVDIGSKYNKTSAQVALRYQIQRGIVIIPKSSKIVIVNDKYYNFDCEKTINYDC